MSIFALIFLVAAPSPNLWASDHIDGPVTTANRVADLTDLYAFPTPRKPGFLTLILNAYPFVGTSGHYTDKVNYTLIIRRASLKESGDPAFFDTQDEVSINCTFKTPAVTADHVVRCKSTNGLNAENKYGIVTDKAEGDDFRLYSGMRSDPFFFNSNFATALTQNGKLLAPKNDDIMNHMNILTIVMDIEVAKLYKENPPALLAIAAETTTRDAPGGPLRRLDRIGRPEITNVSMVAHGDTDLRDQYNLDRPFAVPPANQKLYRDRLAKNIAFYDAVDGHADWTDKDRDQLATILADDFLVVDITKPCRPTAYFEIEKSIFRHRPYETCGGRKPNDDIMDTLYTLYIGGLDGKLVSDGVNSPSREVSEQFPYLAEPDLTLVGRMKAFLVKKYLGIP